MNVYRKLLVPLIAIMPLGANLASAQTEPPNRNQGTVRFFPVSELPYDDLQPAGIGSRVANPKDYPATFYSVQVGGRCTSGLVGSRVLLTAAHCVSGGAVALISVRQQEYRAICTQAPGYKQNETADWALCLLSADVPNIAFENVNADQALLEVGYELLLSGFGCTRPDGTGGNDGVFRIGEAPIRRLPTSSVFDIVTVGKVAVCFGDSGGPAFAFLDAARTIRVQVAVNSRGNIKDTSYLSSLSSTAAIEFMKDWSARSGVKICGLHKDATNCRSLH